MRSSTIIGFRLRAHHLDRRRPARELLTVAGACGVQDSPPGSALLALHARAEDVTRSGVDQLIARDKALLQTWCMRGAPHMFPTADAHLFTTGALPVTQEARLHLIAGVEPALRRVGLGLDEAVDLAAAEVEDVLSGRRLAIRPLGRELAERVAGKLTAAQLSAWRDLGPYAADQPLGEAVIHFCLRILSLQGLVCLAPREGNTATFVLVPEWLGHALPQRDPQECRMELLRRYLHCYGPSTRADFAAWLGVRVGDVDPWWAPMAAQLADVAGAWMLADDVPAARRAALPSGLRLLPPGDPYTQARDRATMVAGEHRGDVWRTAGSPGVVLIDGRIAGIWRARKRGHALTVAVAPFRPLGDAHRARLIEECGTVGALRGATTVGVVGPSGDPFDV